MVSTPATAPLTLGELARAAEVPVGTVKYYLREGLLPEGRLRSTTRADYDETHLARLRLLRLLREVGDVPVGRLRDLVAALEDHGADRPHRSLGVLAAGSSALAGPVPAPGPLAERADALAGELADEVGWDDQLRAAPEWAAVRSVLETVLAWERLGLPVASTDLRPYVVAADLVARHDVAALGDGDPTDLLTQLVVGQVVYGRLLEVLRRLGEAHHSLVRYGPPDA
ncbi:hypothetical protein ENKNEFLB_00615 [Nocardioides aquaticus]|uniref:HTH merR-type domain-containing protein n=3 Tax=Nocardioides aquaticus TaxID=160826 RepID=A0ABX8EGP7_9ACTN|nr:MerR family transcriptional regulator [Nocardioides aquaticus]QVT78242.1 hypothetical protein ENKNEFLB_00615 [Nocardioides aquaticus]